MCGNNIAYRRGPFMHSLYDKGFDLRLFLSNREVRRKGGRDRKYHHSYMWANQRLKNKSNHTHVASLVVKLKVKDFHACMCVVYD